MLCAIFASIVYIDLDLNQRFFRRIGHHGTESIYTSSGHRLQSKADKQQDRSPAEYRDYPAAPQRIRHICDKTEPRPSMRLNICRISHAILDISQDLSTVSKIWSWNGSLCLLCGRSESRLSFLFESAATTETIGRYSFVGAGPQSYYY